MVQNPKILQYSKKKGPFLQETEHVIGATDETQTHESMSNYEFVIFIQQNGISVKTILSQDGQKSFSKEVGLKLDYKKDKRKEQHKRKQRSNEYGQTVVSDRQARITVGEERETELNR